MDTPTDQVRFNCPSCGKRLKVRAEDVGKPARCPKCGERSVGVGDAGPPTGAEVVTWEPGMTAPGEPEAVFDPDTEAADPSAPPVLPPLAAVPVGRGRPRRRRHYFSGDTSPVGVPVAVIGAAVGAFCGAAAGWWFSQYLPIFGDIVSIHLAEPGSPARMAYIPHHLFAGVVLGAIPVPALVFITTRGGRRS